MGKSTAKTSKRAGQHEKKTGTDHVASDRNAAQLNAFVRFLFQPVDHASSTFFRIAWGCISASWAWSYLTEGRVTELYVKPKFHFPYPGFEWIEPWPGEGMYWHFWAMLLLALAVAAGAFYRITTVLFALAFTYFFLLDQTNYQNHYYLMLLVSWAICFLPLHRGLSWDAKRNPEITASTLPRWVLVCLQVHVAFPYLFGGVAKLVPDWMLGQPMGMMLQQHAELPLIGNLLAASFAGVVFSWAGMLFDLLIVPALIWRRTRTIAYLACIAFHLSNSVLFNIHVFPWFMIAATTVFFDPDWPRRLLGGSPIALPKPKIATWTKLAGWKKATICMCIVYLLFHCVWPLRHRWYPGDASWNEKGHFFAWRMMLRGKTGGVRFFVSDPARGDTFSPNHMEFVGPSQAGKFPRNPEWVLQLAHYINEYYSHLRDSDVQVRAVVMLSLNGRKPQLLVDPNVDLSQIEPGQSQESWVLPLEEPLRREPWNLPLDQWEPHIEIPPLEFLERYPMRAAEGPTPAGSENDVPENGVSEMRL